MKRWYRRFRFAVVAVDGAGGVFFEAVEPGDHIVEHERRADDGELARHEPSDHRRLDKLPAFRGVSPRAYHLADEQYDKPVVLDPDRIHGLSGRISGTGLTQSRRRTVAHHPDRAPRYQSVHGAGTGVRTAGTV